MFREPEVNFRVISPDVGGGFGMKGGVYPEDALVVWAARKTGRPVKWVAERTEGLMSDSQARDCISNASLALDADGRFLGLRIETDFAQGAYLTNSAGVPSGLGSHRLYQLLRHSRRRMCCTGTSIRTRCRWVRIAAPASRRRSI